MAIDRKGNILVVDALLSSIHIFSPKGKLIATVGEKGGKNGYFNFPNDIAVRFDDVVYIADKENNRIQAVKLIY